MVTSDNEDEVRHTSDHEHDDGSSLGNSFGYGEQDQSKLREATHSKASILALAKSASPPSPRAIDLRVRTSDDIIDKQTKIYALMCKIGFNVMTNMKELKTIDRIKLLSVEHYAEFKYVHGGDDVSCIRSYVEWTDVLTSVNSDNIRPLTPDKQIIEKYTKMYIDVARGVQGAQLDMVSSMKQESERDEKNYYRRVVNY